MSARPNAVELLRLRDELDALDQKVPDGWSFRIGVFVVSLFLFLWVFGALNLPFAIMATFFAVLVAYERRVRRSRLLREREVLQRRILLIEDSQRD